MFSATSACSQALPYAAGVLYVRRATNHHTVGGISKELMPHQRNGRARRPSGPALAVDQGTSGTKALVVRPARFSPWNRTGGCCTGSR
ncbi:hypothetical protein ACLB9X_23075 [Streptomyces sp. 5K101]|uniref:hypothetical protein n=1 Tax=Streptomyces sp. 5K101 TaxID=3390037 RepID=UPI00397555B6